MALEELSRPLSVIDALFEQNLRNNNGTPTPEFGERDHFRKVFGFDNEESLAKIPCLNDVELAESVPPFSLVRYRCLVQDVFDPEFYAALFQEVDAGGASRLVTTKYRECIEPAPGRQLQELDGHDGLLQRGACYCVPLPGERSWARSVAAEWTVAGGGSISSVQPQAAASVPSTSAKRGRDEDVSMEPQEEVAQRPVTRLATGTLCQPCNAPGMEEGGRLGTQANGGLKTAEDFGLNFPIPSEEHHGTGASTACIVKLYDADSEALRLCDSVEVIGILCVNPDIASLPDAGTGKMANDWRDAKHPSTSLVPRLHALAVRHLPFHHPLLPYTTNFLTEQRLASAFQKQFSAPGAMLNARAAAVEILARCLGSDALAAEYLLMLLVARSFSKHGEKLLGSWSLNFARAAGLDTRAISEAAGELVPRAVHLDLTIDNLNQQRWRPRKDFVADRVVAAQLQLAAGTLLMVDETKMSEGQLTADGHKALLSLQRLVTENKLACDFVSYDVNIPLELGCVLLSERKSVIKDVEVLVPLRIQAAGVQGVTSAMSPQALAAARWLIALVTRSTQPLRIPEEVMSVFGNDFAAVRQEFKVSPDLAHTWLSLARARCLTFGEEELSLARWREVMELERTRLLRCREDALIEV